MFFEYVGRYFSAAPRLKALPAGSACTLCGATSARLWLTASGEASCIAQQTITRKRAARASAADPLLPAENPAGMTAMGDGNFVVAGPHRALLVTKLLPDTIVPPGVEVVFSEKGSIRKARLDLLRSPPPPPFVAIAFEKNARFAVRVTSHESIIFLNGPSAQTLDRGYLNRLVEIASKAGPSAMADLMGLRHRLAGGLVHLRPVQQRAEDQAALLALRASGTITPAEFRALPSPGSPAARLLLQLVE